jgi:hypothetical protein
MTYSDKTVPVLREMLFLFLLLGAVIMEHRFAVVGFSLWVAVWLLSRHFSFAALWLYGLFLDLLLLHPFGMDIIALSFLFLLDSFMRRRQGQLVFRWMILFFGVISYSFVWTHDILLSVRGSILSGVLFFAIFWYQRTRNRWKVV